eukprot:TRINITY_DN7888_c0_g1_i1.p1 TRINITY_DN7888_c0_g1~~TRINITY_DN7888_c0_g1_i1.p1  ORF type:complete len:284 (+),score=89.43 TRINITY_DN7888_c0_g1_i1:71-922(+)
MAKKVFVLGATGIIGLAVARAFVRKGYVVSGLARSEDKANLLLKNEVIPVRGEAKDTASWTQVAEESDVIVEAVGDYVDYSTPSILLKALSEIAKKKPSITIIYTSGVWVLGESRDVELTEEKVNPTPLVQWRPAVEQAYVGFNGIVLRPGIVYGTTAGIPAGWFSAVKGGKLVIGPKQFAGTIHAEDTASAYVLAAENEKARGQIFNLSGYPTDLVATFQHLQEKVEFTLEEAEGSHPFEVAVRLSSRVSDKKAKEVLGWEPHALPLEHYVSHYYNVWAAYN